MGDIPLTAYGLSLESVSFGVVRYARELGKVR